jgi:predicted kinase
MAPLWTILVIGPPTSGKSSLARRLVQALPDSVRINPDDLRLMMYDDLRPVHDEDLVYQEISAMRDLSLSGGHSVVIDSTAPRRLTRRYLFGGEGNRSRRLIVVMDVDGPVLQQRSVAGNKADPLRSFQSVWQEPGDAIPLFKFKNNDTEQFETSFFLLMQYIDHEYPQHSSLLRSIFRFARRASAVQDDTKLAASPE